MRFVIHGYDVDGRGNRLLKVASGASRRGRYALVAQGADAVMDHLELILEPWRPMPIEVGNDYRDGDWSRAWELTAPLADDDKDSVRLLKEILTLRPVPEVDVALA